MNRKQQKKLYIKHKNLDNLRVKNKPIKTLKQITKCLKVFSDMKFKFIFKWVFYNSR